MPSNSYINFLRIKEDVSNLVSNFHFFNWVNTADEEPNHLVRSAILMLCAAWERYNEDLLLESIDFLCQNFSEMNQLNLDVKKHISIKVKQAKNEIKPIELSGDGWKKVWLEYAQEETRTLNSPNSENLRLLFRRFLGVNNICDYWNDEDHTDSKSKVNELVKNRGDIAHNGNLAGYISIVSLGNHVDTITDIAILVDSKICDDLQTNIIAPTSPWDKTYFRELDKYNR